MPEKMSSLPDKPLHRNRTTGGGRSSLFMSQNQHLIDSLTSHISLYTSAIPSPNLNPSPRSSVLKWFSTLTPHQRQSHLTAVDPSFVRILLQMLDRVASRGSGTFIILPDLPSPDNLPGLCYRQSSGLLSRAAVRDVPERRIFESARLFSSKEGDSVKECSVSVNWLDSLTVGEELVRVFDLFLETMEGVSNGGFLRGEVGELGEDWVELDWLKAKGYYSISAFVANRLEVALRLAWLSCNNGKKRGVKLKEKVGTSSVSANVFWRKKGCLDWWQNLELETRRKALAAVMGKSTKNLIQEILAEADNGAEVKLWAFNGGSEHSLNYDQKASSRKTTNELHFDAGTGSIISRVLAPGNRLAYYFNRLFVLQNVITIILSCLHNSVDPELQFFSTLGCLGTLTDCILRKLRGLLMFIYLDYTKLELLGEQICSAMPNKVKEKSGSTTRRKKRKSHNSKRVNPITSSCQNLSQSQTDKSHKEPRGTSPHTVDVNMMESAVIRGKKVPEETTRGFVSGIVQDTSKKNKKGKRNSRNTVLKLAKEVKDFENLSAVAGSSSGISNNEAAGMGQRIDKTVHPNSSKDVLRESSAVESSSSSCNSPPRLNSGGGASQCSVGDLSVGLTEKLSCTVSECSQPYNSVSQNVGSCLESSNCELTSKEVKASHCSQAIGTASISEDTSSQKSEIMTRSDPKSTHLSRKVRVSDLKGGRIKGEERVKFGYQIAHDYSSALQSQEWPSVASYSPSPNSHLPPAADRLHLDVGRNWHNHFHRPFLPTIHQTRNSPIENGCKQVLTRSLPMSLDWPPVLRGSCSLASSVACSYDPGFIQRRQTPFHQGFAAHSLHLNVTPNNNEKKYSGDFLDKSEVVNMHDLDECDGQWISEEELEVHGVSGLDYNQYFGGGIMYWNPSDYPGTGFSRPPSLSSDDSFWAWQEADMNRAVDDMVAFSSSYSTNGLASPTAASFCSPFDPLSSGHQALGYVMAGSEVTGLTDPLGDDEASRSLTSITADIDGKSVDSLPYPVLRPIIIPSISRERSKRSHDLKSPCIPPSRREKPQIKRPPSPVVLCVPRAPRPPPPSPVGDSRKHRGFPAVRSGSSSPRHWGVRGWHHDNGNSNLDEGCVRIDGAEVVLPWRTNNLSTHPMIQPLTGSLLQDRLIAISQLTRDQEHPDVALPLQPPDQQNSTTRKTSLSFLHSTLHDEIESFWNQVVSENLSRKPYINWAVKRVTRSLQVLWPRSRTNIFGSNATGLALPTSDVDLVVCLPPVRNLEPIKEAGILEGRNGIKETCLQHAARYLANQDWVKNDSLKTVENTAIPIIMLEAEVPPDLVTSNASRVQSPKEDPVPVRAEDSNPLDFEVGEVEDSVSPSCSQTTYECKVDRKTVRLDISFKSASHTGLQTTELVRQLTEQFPAATPLALLLKQFLADRSLDQSYSGGLSSYCLVLLVTRFLQHEHHLGRSINQVNNFGSLLMDFLYFFGNVFDPRQMRVSVRGSGLYMTRVRGHSIDPIHIDDPLCPTNNVGRNCFRIHQCIKAFSEAYSLLEQELACLSDKGGSDTGVSIPYKLLQKIIPGISQA